MSWREIRNTECKDGFHCGCFDSGYECCYCGETNDSPDWGDIEDDDWKDDE